MIGKVLQNNYFGETARYVLDKEKARVLKKSVLEEKSEAIVQEFSLSRDLNPQIERPVYHLVESYSYKDAATQTLDDEFLADRAIEHFAGLVVSSRQPELLRKEDKTEYKQKVDEFIENELYEYQWFCAAHEDRKHKHTHFVASRINLIDGRCIPTWQDQERSHRICREFEKDYGLEQLQSYYEIERRSPTRKQIDAWNRTGIPPVMVKIQDAIDQEAIPGRSIEDVQTALKENHNIDSVVVEPEGKQSYRKGKAGIVFQQTDTKGERVRMSGSQLGRGYTLPAISNRLEQDIDIKAPEKTTEIETLVQPDPLQTVLNQQSEYAHRLAPQLKEIFDREKTNQSKLEVATYENYQIRSSGDELELYRGNRRILGYSGNEPQGYGLTEQDCTAVAQFNQISQQQALERLRQAEIEVIQIEKGEETKKNREYAVEQSLQERQVKHEKEYDLDIEL